MARARTVNIGRGERVGRVVGGAVVAAVGLAVLLAGAGFWAGVGALLAVAAGLDFVVTGAIGYCPLYARLGHVPRSLQEAHR